MDFQDIIAKKRDGRALSEAELEAFAQGAATGAVPDYQLSALLMAIRLRGMDAKETAALTLAMARSGRVADLSSISGVKVDKHSTGGVGDTTTLICVPLVAACGVPVVKMSGSGLGHTGGTLDKLHALDMRTDLSPEECLRVAARVGAVVNGQTADMVPADGVLYALRDVTATVDSLPLIASSILSKKIAAGCEAIVLDVKVGDGAFLKTQAEAEALARCMVEIGTRAGRHVRALLTDMEAPLGNMIGNALEVREAIGVLRCEVGGPLLDVSLALAKHMLLCAGWEEAEARARLESALHTGEGLEKLRAMVEAQHGDARRVEAPDTLPTAPVRRTVRARRGGILAAIPAEAIGRIACGLGAGRKRKADAIDLSAGIELLHRVGDTIRAGDALCVLHAPTESAAEMAENAICDVLLIQSDAPVHRPLLPLIIH